MARNYLILFLNRNFSSKSPRFRSHSPICRLSYLWGNGKYFSTSIPTEKDDLKNQSEPKSSLSARMSFVFDQIDAIEKERNIKDEALQRIRSWRDTKKDEVKNENAKERHTPKMFDEMSQTRVNSLDDNELLGTEEEEERKKKEKASLIKKEIEIVHPWPEWIELMERLIQQKYFDHNSNGDEDKIAQENVAIDAEDGFDFTRDLTTVRYAFVKFGRDRFDILRSLSRQDIQNLVGYGCPSVDTKVVFSAKTLRKHVHLDEGDVCSSCSLRSTCAKAYLVPSKEDEARTVDVIRVLFTYGFDAINESVHNKPLLKMKSVKTVVRKLLHEVVKLSAVPIDPNLPPPVFKKPPPKVKQPPPTPKKRVGRDDIEMKKGDWLCQKCDFMNFAKNSVCLQCDAKRPKRQLLPGEWECPGCNFLNYRRNMACFHCDHQRPPDEFTNNQSRTRSHDPRTSLEKVSSLPGGSNAWNFDFDDNESDGADVAAFEYADSPRRREDSSLLSEEGGRLSDFEDDSSRTNRISRASERDRHPDRGERKLPTGFDDFADEEDDDINSYELVTEGNSIVHKASLKDLSDVEGYSESEDFDDSHLRLRAQGRGTTQSRSQDPGHDLASEDEDSDRSNWNRSHIEKSRNGYRGGGSSGPYRGLKFVSDDEFEGDSDSDNDRKQGFGPNHRQRSKWSSDKRGLKRVGSSDSEDEFDFGSESDDNDEHPRNKFSGKKPGPVRRENHTKGLDHSEKNHTRFRSNRMNDRRDSFGNADTDRSFLGSHKNNRGSRGDGYGERRMNDRHGNVQKFDRDGGNGNGYRGSQGDGYGGMNDRRAKVQKFDSGGGNGYGRRRMNDRQGNMQNFNRGDGNGYQQRGRPKEFNDRSEIRNDFCDDRPRKRIIER
ncbi:uncharacterized protein LOC113349629 [Papaver somniferum]|nr:uncharacterized protein LOC113349629 [Papaver somniferum]